MHQYEGASIRSMKKQSQHFEDTGYYSVLYTFGTHNPDNWLKIAHTLNTKHTFKYMVALRPLHLSVDYCAMMIEAMNDIQPNRLILNLLAGQNTNNQKEHHNVYMDDTLFQDSQDRRTHVREFVTQLSNHILISNMPEFVISGCSDYTINTVKQNDYTVLSMVSDFYKYPHRFVGMNKIMVLVDLLIRDSLEQAEEDF